MLKIGRETSFRHPIVFQKNFKRVKSKRSAAYFQYISTFLNLAYNKTKLYKTLDYWSRDMFNINFSEKGLGLVYPPCFEYDFSRKTFLMLHFINWPNFTVWYLYFSRYWAICVLELFVNQAVTSKNLKLTLSFLSGRFATWPKCQDKSLKILRTKRPFDVK